MKISITTLGALRITQADRPLSALPSQRLRCGLLIYLAFARQAPRDRLVSLFWGDTSEHRARRALSQNLYELRRVLGDDWIEVRGERISVASHVTIDLHAFDEAMEGGDWAAALALYRGPLLEGFYIPGARDFDGWLENQRMRAQRHHRRARRELLREQVEAVLLREALLTAREWVAIDPADDEGQHRLIELLADTGDRAGALRQFEVYERLLRVDGLSPLDETRELGARIRGGEIGPLPSLPVAPLPEAAAQPRIAAAPDPPDRADTDTAGRSRSRRPARPYFAFAAAVAAVLLVSVGAFARLTRGGSPAAAPTPHQVAVLYLQDLSPPPGTPHLAAALTEALIEQFSNLEPLLAVRSSQAVSQFRDRDIPADSIARALAVDVLVTGDVAEANGVVRVRVQLVDPVSGTVIASRAVERLDGAYFALIDDVVENAAQLLRQRLGTRLDAERLRAGTTSEQAWMDVQRAAELVRGATWLSRTDADAGHAAFLLADSLLRNAESLDRAWAAPAVQRGWLAERRAFVETALGRRSNTRRWLDAATVHADRALEREPGNAAALELRGTIAFMTYTFALEPDEDALGLLRRAEADLAAASRADPGRARAFSDLAAVYFAQGRFAEAATAAGQALRIDAFLKQTEKNLYIIGMSAFELGQDGEAAARCSEGMRRFGGAEFAHCLLSIMAWSDAQPALPDHAWSLARTVPYTTRDGHATVRPMLDMLVAATLARAGMSDSARVVLDHASALPAATAAIGWLRPVVLDRLGDTDHAAILLRNHFDRTAAPDLGTRSSRALHQLLRHPLFAQPAGQDAR
jgi:DNA-binding SARP family transcriptional activator/TolB-like protein